MKNQTFLLASLIASQAAFAEDGYTNVIQMIEMGSGSDAPLLWNMPGNIGASGDDVLVGEPVPENGAIFILRTVQSSPFQDWYLDQAAVGAYLPSAEIEIITHDDEATFPRTRADQPFQVNVSVEGLYDGALGLPLDVIQNAATEVRLQMFAQEYADGQSSLPGGEVTAPSHGELALVGNGDFPKSAGDLTFYTSLNPSSPDRAQGEEHFVVRSLDDGATQGGTLAQEHVQVWPVWSGEMSGLNNPTLLPYSYSGEIPDVIALSDGELAPDPNFKKAQGEIAYEAEPPELTFTWHDLYPTSTVGVIVNDASIPYPWGGRWVGGTQRVFNEDASVNWQDTVERWDGIFGGKGRYAIWMVTFTPGIGWEVGGNYAADGSFVPGGWIVPIQREGIKVRGSIHSLSE
ncbi:hypothetical protein [Roseibacillus persicicus]|uniref:Uncharacterized protein n=1 Tax=Roseibacillus persicicus TaxID=454148 RepID=A0A918WNE7_9BACT|nr:hypothetical protein [Roseibacillus persicicus]MDQ8189868.1 hypothetical protein [Roseibacillus persicicus]GHC62500.1 hypothetical protein GCM10007100_32410 [Roseibacillus persicicus]